MAGRTMSALSAEPDPLRTGLSRASSVAAMKAPLASAITPATVRDDSLFPGKTRLQASHRFGHLENAGGAARFRSGTSLTGRNDQTLLPVSLCAGWLARRRDTYVKFR
jgi:hypothetical protein